MKTTKIDDDSLQKLRMLAERSNRSAPLQLKVIIDSAWKTSPAELTDVEFTDNMMSTIVDNVQAGVPTQAAIDNAEQFASANRISWGEENGRIIGVMADGTRCDVNGHLLP